MLLLLLVVSACYDLITFWQYFLLFFESVPSHTHIYIYIPTHIQLYIHMYIQMCGTQSEAVEQHKFAFKFFYPNCRDFIVA